MTLSLFPDIEINPYRKKKDDPNYHKKRNKRWRELNAGKCRVQNRKRNIKLRRETKLKVIDHYSQGKKWCGCCGENHIEFLTIDHIFGGGGKHRKEIAPQAGLSFYRWLIKNKYPDGFRVLCMNCNFSLGKYRYCPHQKSKGEDLNGKRI